MHLYRQKANNSVCKICLEMDVAAWASTNLKVHFNISMYALGSQQINVEIPKTAKPGSDQHAFGKQKYSN